MGARTIRRAALPIASGVMLLRVAACSSYGYRTAISNFADHAQAVAAVVVKARHAVMSNLAAASEDNARKVLSVLEGVCRKCGHARKTVDTLATLAKTA